MLLIATFIHRPGIGCSPSERNSAGHHQALQHVKAGLQQVANELNIDLPDYSLPTLRKDLETLRRYGILHSRMYRWGYYLGTGAMTQSELQLMLQVLQSQAQYQGDSQARCVYETLERRLRGFDLELDGELFYPVRSQLNRVIVHTDPEEMMARGEYRHTLFHQLPLLETAILKGQAIRLYQSRNPFGTATVGDITVYPLQLIYADVAWYLLFETYRDNHLVIERIDRFTDVLEVVDVQGRELALQQERLAIAHHLLMNGWGLYLGSFAEQQAEINNTIALEQTKVRFFPEVLTFILEGDRRHPTQRLKLGPKDATGKVAYLDYSLQLPPRSLGEFGRWVNSFMHHAVVLSPSSLVEKQRSAIQQLVRRYGL